MANHHGRLNILSGEGAVDALEIRATTYDSGERDAWGVGARVTSEAIFRTLGNVGIALPESFSQALTAEFDIIKQEVRDEPSQLSASAQGTEALDV